MLRLIAMHDDIAAAAEHARRNNLAAHPENAADFQAFIYRRQRQIAERIAGQGIGWEGENPPLRYGVPDAVREYRRLDHSDFNPGLGLSVVL